MLLFKNVLKQISGSSLHNNSTEISPYITRNLDTVPLFNNTHTSCNNSFFPSTTIEQNNLNQELAHCETYSLFRCNILELIRPSLNSFSKCQNIIDIKFVTRLCLGLTPFPELKFKHSFQDILNPIYSYDTDVKSYTHFLLQCPFFLNKSNLSKMSNLNKIDPQLPKLVLPNLPNTLLFGNLSFSDKINALVLDATIKYIL